MKEIVSQALERYGDAKGAEQFYLLQALSRGDGNEIQSYEKALRIRPRFPLALFARGVLHVTQGDLDAAIHDYDGALAIRPRFVAALANRGSVKGRREEALVDAKEAVKVAPGRADCWMEQAMAREANGDAEGSIADYEKAISMMGAAPKGGDRVVAVDAHLFVAGLYVGRDKAKALDHLSQAVALDEGARAKIAEDRQFAPLHDDPKWADLIKRPR